MCGDNKCHKCISSLFPVQRCTHVQRLRSELVRVTTEKRKDGYSLTSATHIFPIRLALPAGCLTHTHPHTHTLSELFGVYCSILDGQQEDFVYVKNLVSHC